MSDSTLFPRQAPTVEGGAITVDLMLNEPKRIDNYLSTIVEKDLLSTRLFTPDTTSGGALIFEQLTEAAASETTNKPGEVSPGAEFPVLWTPEGEPMVVSVAKTGGKFPVTDEARKRNDMAGLQRKVRMVANTMRNDLDRRAVSTLDAALDQIPEALILESANWEENLDVAKGEATSRTAAGAFFEDIARAQKLVKDTDLGYQLDTLIINSNEELTLKLLLGHLEWQSVLTSLGLTPVVSNEAAAGSPIVVASGLVGTVGVEDPISTETWRDPATQVEWSQTWASVAYGVTDPLAMVRIQGAGAEGN